jgi:4-alpha-glucanotransferase
VVYTGTHDNDTALGWFESLDPHTKYLVESDLPMCESSMPWPWPLAVAALNSPAQWAIIPMQDLLELGTEARMNIPGVIGDNWLWQFSWAQVSKESTEKLNRYIQRSGRTTTSNKNNDVLKESNYG